LRDRSGQFRIAYPALTLGAVPEFSGRRATAFVRSVALVRLPCATALAYDNSTSIVRNAGGGEPAEAGNSLPTGLDKWLGQRGRIDAWPDPAVTLSKQSLLKGLE